MLQYHHPQPYSCLSLPKLDLGGESHPPATHCDPNRAPKQPAKRPYQQSFSLLPNTWLVRGTLGSISPPTTLFLSQPTSAGPRGGTPLTCNPGRPHQSPKTTRNTSKSSFFFVAIYMASMRNSWSSITTYNPFPVPAYLSWT